MKKISSIIVLIIVFGLFSNYGFAQNINGERVSFNENWRFSRFGLSVEEGKPRVEEDKGIEKVNYDDSSWRKLDLPHDWGIDGNFRDDLENNTGLLPWRAIGWYRKDFVVSKDDSDKKLFIDFDGAMANAEVWLNGNYVGKWPYGYTSFRFDLTPFVKFGEKNVIAVCLDTEKMDSRWYPGAGIYRNVWIVKTDKVHFDHWGIYITTPTVGKAKGVYNVRIDLKNETLKAKKIFVHTSVYNEKDELVSSTDTTETLLSPNSEFRTNLKAEVKSPELWDVENPYLYTAVTVIENENGVIEKNSTKFGFRTIAFNTKGFFLNGKRVEVKGVCNHHDLGPLGAAFNVSAARRQLELLQGMGCNAIRTSHNPPAPELLDLCDEMGFLVQVEAFDSWKHGKQRNDYHTIFDEWHEEDLRAMIRRDWNHPSVFMWSVGNEVPDQYIDPSIAKDLAAITRMEDPTRPVTSGCNAGVAGWNGYQLSMDVFGYNYNHWSYEKFFSTPENDSLPFIASETTSCLSSRGEFSFPVVQGDAMKNAPGNGNYQLSSYDLLSPGWGNPPDFQFKMNDENPRIMGEFVWTGFDYLGEPTPFNNDKTNLLNFRSEEKRKEIQDWLDKLGDDEVPSRSSYFGIFDLCGFPKDRFYIYQSQWKPELPMVHILPHWNWEERIGEVTPVHIYTSGDEVELFLNGKSLGRKKMKPLEYRLRWDDVVYKPGELKAVAYKNGKKWATDVVRTTKKASRIAMTSNVEEIKNNGDLIFVTVKVTDRNGVVVPRTHNMIDFEISGPGKIIATGNGDPASHESFKATNQSVFNGLCLVVIRPEKGKTGKIKLSAKSKDLRSSKLTVEVK